MRFALGVLVACGSAPPPAPTPAPPIPVPAELEGQRPSAMLAGRVLLDGKPVRHFGIVTVKEASYNWWGGAVAMPVRSRDGRFFIRGTPGTYDVVIAGPGFTRKLISNQQLAIGRTTQLGDIAVRRGFTVSGTITDAHGPVTDATVAIQQTHGAPIDGSLTAHAFGNLRGKSDGAGRFSIPDVTAIEAGSVWISARKSGVGATYSESVGVQNGNVAINLRVHPAGWIEGTVRDPNESLVTATRSSEVRHALRGSRTERSRSSGCRWASTR
jgi:hypothetical protein